LRVSGANKTHVSNWSGEDSIPKLQPEAGRSNNVLFDSASTPSATVNGHSLRCYALEVEPPARDPIHTLIQHPNFVKGVSGRDEHTVAGVEILLSYFFERSRLLDPGRKRLRDGSQFGTSETCCAAPIGTSTCG
jgi:hypothetical protein